MHQTRSRGGAKVFFFEEGAGGGGSRETWVAVCRHPSNPALNLFKKKNLGQSWHSLKGFRSKKTPYYPTGIFLSPKNF